MSDEISENISSSHVDIDADLTVDVKDSEVKDASIRQRIDDLLEQKRLKALLDDSEDW
ncbi:PA3496 family putative envelope integrity protein [Thalassotalea castellviae]|uniref:Uncharacterized protein n=1 Tax=Thalassotalea castellviae TaxID=3075612 RepID=A0ABU3A4Z6_9GAMM|nr:hypothetical protein [Thalassotalea sp. W431]MDT0604607.1 hypothetical protein [Thalassotalea sp. W431]